MGSTSNSASVVNKTKDIKSENVPLCLVIRRLTVNSERGTSEFVKIKARLQDIWRDTVVRKLCG